MSNDWRVLKSFDEVCRRAAGRRRYNAKRQLAALERRREVARLVQEHGICTRGAKAKIARLLKVHKSTVTRDMQFLFAMQVRCPTCESVLSEERLADLRDMVRHELEGDESGYDDSDYLTGV